MDNTSELAEWLMVQCEEQNLSWSEASRRAGVSPNSISEIVSGVQPGAKRLSALAQFFGVAPEFLFQLAGILPPRTENGRIPPEQMARIDHIIGLWRDVAELEPGSLGRLLNVVEGQAQMALALLEAGRRLKPSTLEEEKANSG